MSALFDEVVRKHGAELTRSSTRVVSVNPPKISTSVTLHVVFDPAVPQETIPTRCRDIGVEICTRDAEVVEAEVVLEDDEEIASRFGFNPPTTATADDVRRLGELLEGLER